MKRIDILLAMGSPALLSVTEEALLREGFSVKTVSDGIDAVTEAFLNKPRIVICGQILAGMDGMKVSRFLSSVFSQEEMPVIISVPDKNQRNQRKAASASSVAVIDYSTALSEIVNLVQLHISSVGASTIQVGLPLSRDRIIQMTADSIEDSLEAVETVINLASELSSVTSVSEACRKAVVSVLGGLGFQRVWIGLLNSTGSAVEAVAYRGRGITGEPIPLSLDGGRMPVDAAVSSGIQVASWELDFQDNRETWVGSITYVDTPVKVNGRVIGIIRCDNGISKKRPSDSNLRVLKMLAGELSSFMKYFTVQDKFDNFKGTFEIILRQLSSRAIILNDRGDVDTTYGDKDLISGTRTVTSGTPMAEIWDNTPQGAVEILQNAFSEKQEVILNSIQLIDTENYIDVSILQSDSGGMTILSTDSSIRSKLEKKVSLLEFETDAIASLAADLTSLSDVREICRTMLRTVETFYPDEAIVVLAAVEVSSSLVPDELIVHAVSGYGYSGSGILPGAAIKVAKSSTEPGIVSEAVRTGRIINVPDVLQSGIFMNVLPDIRSELVIPMLSRGRVVGVIDLESTQANRFNSGDIRRLNNLVGFASGVLETALQQTELINLARHDRLTGLNNMTFFEERYPEEFERADRYEYSFSLIMMDIDDFKHYNDSFGHPMGNVLLQKLARVMTDALRDVDLLIRYGGEEFVCILPLTDKQVASDIAERIRAKVVEASKTIPNTTEQPRGFLSLSLGVATFPVDSREKDELLEIADQRMYRAKRAGKNRVCSN